MTEIVEVTSVTNVITIATPGPQGPSGSTSASAQYAASAGSAPIPASVSYSASSGLASNSTNFAGQAQSYYAPIASPNFTTGASIGGVALATRTFVSTSYAPLASPTFTGTVNLGTNIATGSVSYATNASNATTTSQTNFSNLTISSSAVATQAYVATASVADSAKLGGTFAASYALLASPTFTGTVNLGSNTATGSVSYALNSASLSGQPGSYYAPISSPNFTGTPLAPTAASGTTTTQIATTQFVQSALATHAALTASSGYYGAFSSSTTQTTTANTAKAIVLEQNDGSNGVSVNSSSITFTYPGVYNIQWSGQFNNTSNSDHDVNVWIRKNGVDVVGSNGIISIPSKHGSVNGHTIAAWNYILTLNSGDILQFYWMPDDAAVTLEYYPPTTVTSTQSVIVTAQLVTYIQQGSSIAGGSATNVTFIGGTANFNSASISGSSVATQSYVTGQGYLISSGSIASASNSASLGGQSASYYAPIASPNFTTGASVGGAALATQSFVTTSYAPIASPSFTGTVNLGSNTATGSVSYATNAGNATTTSQTNFTSLTISSSAVATQAYVGTASVADSAKLGGTVAASYALLSSANFTAASVGGNRITTVSDKFTAHTAVVTSSELLGLISDETGTGNLVFNTSPSFVTPNIGNATGSVTYATNAGNSASFGGQASSYYYPASSISNASVAYATSAGNSSSTSQTSFPILTSGSVNITSTSSTTVPLTVQGASAQSANLQEWKNSSASVLSSVNASGGANFASASISGSAIATQAFVAASYTPLNTTIVTQTSNYTLALSDSGNLFVGGTSNINYTLTVPNNASVAFPVGTQVTVVSNTTGSFTISPAASVTFLYYSPTSASTVTLKGQHAGATVVKTATDTWRIIGNVT